MSLAKKGRAFMQAHPQCKPVDLVENCGFKLPYAITFWYEEHRKIFNKEHLKNRPKHKPIEAPKEAPKKPMEKATVDWEKNYRGAMMCITSLEKQIVGYKAVINYLEHQIEKYYGSSV